MQGGWAFAASLRPGCAHFGAGKGPVVASPSDICRVHGAPTTASRVEGQTKLEINGK